MTAYHLHARKFHGKNLSDPKSKLLFQSRETDDFKGLDQVARDLAKQGYEVVIYDHKHPSPLSGACDYRQIRKYFTNGTIDTTPDPPGPDKNTGRVPGSATSH